MVGGWDLTQCGLVDDHVLCPMGKVVSVQTGPSAYICNANPSQRPSGPSTAALRGAELKQPVQQ